MKGLFAAIVVLALAVFPALVMAGETLPKPEALTEETINLTEKLSKNYDTLVIRDFTAEGAEYERVDAEERAKIDKMQPLLVSNITLSLEGELKSRKLFKNIVKNGAPTGKAVILEGKFVEYNAGSRAMKFFVGFGAGKAYLRVKGRLVDAKTGAELALFEDRETGYRGSLSMESFEDLFPHQAKSIGENLAQFVEKLY
jgi:uncharacterized protein DUF4410